MPTTVPPKTGSKSMLQSWFAKIIDIKHWDKYVWVVIILTLIGGFLRFYQLDETVMFLGDQGRDAIVVSRMFTDFDPVFIGPVTSVGNMYLGPFYYYFMLPFLWLSYPSPMGPVYAVAFFGTVLIPLTYFLGAPMFGKRAAIFATVLIAMSSSLISLSRFSWNPNLMPIFGLTWLFCLYQAAAGKRWYWIGVALTVVILLQLHYITFLAVSVSVLVCLWRFIQDYRRNNWRPLLQPVLIGLAIVALFQLPLILFDLRHDWLNVRQFLRLFSSDDAFATGQTGLMRLAQILHQSRARLSQLIVEESLEFRSSNSVLFAYLVLGAVVAFWAREKRRFVRQAVQLSLSIVLIALVGLSIYKNDVYLHYLGFLLPVVYLLFGYVLDQLMQLNRLQVIIVGAVLVSYIWQNIYGLSFVGGGPRLPMLQATAQAIHDHVQQGEPYTVMLISESKDLYGMNYRYFLTTNHEKRPLDPERFDEAKKMFVLWEDKEVVEPLKLPLYELLVFDVATPSATFEVPNGPTVLELRKN